MIRGAGMRGNEAKCYFLRKTRLVLVVDVMNVVFSFFVAVLAVALASVIGSRVVRSLSC